MFLLDHFNVWAIIDLGGGGDVPRTKKKHQYICRYYKVQREGMLWNAQTFQNKWHT